MTRATTPRPMAFRVHVALDYRGTVVAVALSRKSLRAVLTARNAGDNVTVARFRVDGHPFAVGMLSTMLHQHLQLEVPMSAVRVL